jgi:hypothetical protein
VMPKRDSGIHEAEYRVINDNDWFLASFVFLLWSYGRSSPRARA